MNCVVLKKEDEMPELPIIVALDNMSYSKAMDMARLLDGKVWGFKLSSLIVQYGISIIPGVRGYGQIFADLKFHDIPNTVRNHIQALDGKADLISVHASGGIDMMLAARETAVKSKIVAVTTLTSYGGELSRDEYVETITKIALANIDTIVCSGIELKTASAYAHMTTIVPGIRPLWYEKQDDQKRTITPREAMRCGADLLVIGRPITQNSDPLAALKRIGEELTA